MTSQASPDDGERVDEGRVDQDRVRAAGLRRVALASVAALAVVLPLAVATAGSEHGDGQRGNAGHSASHPEPSSDDD